MFLFQNYDSVLSIECTDFRKHEIFAFFGKTLSAADRMIIYKYYILNFTFLSRITNGLLIDRFIDMNLIGFAIVCKP